MPLFQYETLCVKRTSALCGQRTDIFQIWSGFSVLSGQIFLYDLVYISHVIITPFPSLIYLTKTVYNVSEKKLPVINIP